MARMDNQLPQFRTPVHFRSGKRYGLELAGLPGPIWGATIEECIANYLTAVQRLSATTRREIFDTPTIELPEHATGAGSGRESA